jgi:hypothetical protein
VGGGRLQHPATGLFPNSVYLPKRLTARSGGQRPIDGLIDAVVDPQHGAVLLSPSRMS